MKLLFLDCDGVLNHIGCEYTGETSYVVDPDCVIQLNRIIKETECVLIVSSTWRLGKATLELEKFFTDLGVTKNKVLARTPSITHIPPKDITSIFSKEVEINFFLKYHQIVQNVDLNMVVLDDEADIGDFTPYLIQTDKHGLTEEKADSVIDFLNSSKSRLCGTHKVFYIECICQESFGVVQKGDRYYYSIVCDSIEEAKGIINSHKITNYAFSSKNEVINGIVVRRLI